MFDVKSVFDLMVSVILEWNKLDVDMRISTCINIFKKPLLQFIRPLPNSQFNWHSPQGIKHEIGLRISLSHLRKQKFEHSFQDTLNPFRNWCCEIDTTAHHFFSCPQFFTELSTLLNKMKSIDISIVNQNNS